jgi:RHS repeat-associated protein
MLAGADDSRLLTVTYPNGRQLTYNYASGLNDHISRLSSLKDNSTTTFEIYDYLGLGTVVRRAHPQSGVDLTYISQSGGSGDAGDKYTGLDRFGRVVDQLWIHSSTATDDFQYGYDRDSNRLYRNNVVNPAFGELYHANGASSGYDYLNQLTAFARGTLSGSIPGGTLDTITTASRSQSWNLDVMGNFTSQTTGTTTVTRTHNMQNEVTGVGQAALKFDANGNLRIDETGRTLVYDAWNRLVQVKDTSSATLANYAYDALNRRISELGPDLAYDLFGLTHHFYYSANWQVLEERVMAVTHAQYVWSPVYVDALVLRDRDPSNAGALSEHLYVQQDANFNVTALVNTSGTVVERYVYDPYGAPTVYDGNWSALAGSAFAWLYLHQGGRYELQTGLYQFRNREYSPTLGRFVQRDPIGFAAGDTNIYRSVSDSPENFTDPSGLWNLWNPMTWGTRNPNTDRWYNIINPVGESAHWGAAWAGASEGSTLINDNLTGRLILSLHNRANWIRQNGGRTAWWSDYSAGMGTGALYMACGSRVLGGGSTRAGVGVGTGTAVANTASRITLADRGVVIGIIRNGRVLIQASRGGSHESLARQAGVYLGPGRLAPGCEAFSVFKDGGVIYVYGSGNFGGALNISAAAAAALRLLFN